MRMPLRAGRRCLLNRALAAVLAAVICGGTLDWGHAGGDDRDCDSALVLHDHSAHRFAAAPSQSTRPADHCYLCHSLRLLHTLLTARGPRAIVAVRSTLLRQVASVEVLSGPAIALSSRAPPTASL